MFKFKSIVSLSNKFIKPNLFKSYSFLNFFKFPLNIPVNSMKNFLISDLIFSLIKQIGIFLFYMWDWFSLFATLSLIIICLLIIFDFNQILSILSNLFPLTYSWSLFLASSLLNVEVHQVTWYDYFIGYYNSYLGWLNYIYYPCYYIFFPSLWAIKFFVLAIYYPINLISNSWSIIKNICTSLVIITISYFGYKLYIFWDLIFHTTNYLYQATIGLYPGLPQWGYWIMAASLEVLIFPMIHFIQDLNNHQDNLILTLYNYIPSERDLVALTINSLTLSNDLLQNICISELLQLTSFENLFLTVPARIFALPLMLIFEGSSSICNTLISWLTPWL